VDKESTWEWYASTRRNNIERNSEVGVTEPMLDAETIEMLAPEADLSWLQQWAQENSEAIQHIQLNNNSFVSSDISSKFNPDTSKTEAMAESTEDSSEVSHNSSRSSFTARIRERLNNINIRDFFTRKKSAALLAGGLALTSLGLASCGSSPVSAHKKHPEAAVASQPFSLTKNRPADFAEYAFFPSYNNNGTKDVNVVENWFSKSPLGGNAVQGSIALEQAVIADQAYSKDVANNQLDYVNQFNQAFNLMNAGGKVQAESFSNDLKKVMRETYSYDPNFATKGSQLTWLQASYNSKGQINAVNPEHITWEQDSPLGGILFKDPSDAQKLGMVGFEEELVAPSGQVYLEGSLPVGGNVANQNNSHGGKVPQTKTPTGAKTVQQPQQPNQAPSIGVTSQQPQQQPNQAPSGGVTVGITKQQGSASNGSSNANSLGSKPESKQGNLPTPGVGVNTGGPTPEKQQGPTSTPTPETPETPETPKTPETPETPETPQTPETPETPQTPKTPQPLKPAEPEVTTPNANGDGSSNPFQVTIDPNGIVSNMGSASTTGLAQ